MSRSDWKKESEIASLIIPDEDEVFDFLLADALITGRCPVSYLSGTIH